MIKQNSILPTSEIVYIDDEDHNTYLFKDKFEEIFNITCFNKPEEGIDYILSNNRVLLVITDYVMPKIDGIKLAEIIKNKKKYLTFIMATANPENDKSLLYKSLKNNLFYDFIQKPIDFDTKLEDFKKLFTDAIINSLNFYLDIDYDEASKAFCVNPITSFEIHEIQKIITSRFSKNIIIKFSIDNLQIIDKTTSINNLLFEKTNTGIWNLYLSMGAERKKIGLSNKIENLFNFLINDQETRKELKQFFDD